MKRQRQRQREEQLLNAASDILDQIETELEDHPILRDKVRSAHYLIYLVLKPEAQLSRRALLASASKRKRKGR